MFLSQILQNWKKKEKNLLLELVCLFWNSIPLSVKTLNISNFRKKNLITTP